MTRSPFLNCTHTIVHCQESPTCDSALQRSCGTANIGPWVYGLAHAGTLQPVRGLGHSPLLLCSPQQCLKHRHQGPVGRSTLLCTLGGRQLASLTGIYRCCVLRPVVKSSCKCGLGSQTRHQRIKYCVDVKYAPEGSARHSHRNQDAELEASTLSNFGLNAPAAIL